MKLKDKVCWIERQKEMSRYNNQRRHRFQMDISEVWSLRRRIEQIGSWSLSDYTYRRLLERNVDAPYNKIASTLKDYNVVEYGIRYNSYTNRMEERVLVRSRNAFNGVDNLNIVYSLTTEKIITVWLNHHKDRHNTLDWSLYNGSLKIFN